MHFPVSIFLSRWAGNAIFWLLMGGTPTEDIFEDSCRESCALQSFRIIKEMLENIVKIDVLKIKVSFSL